MTKEEAIKILDCYDLGFYDLSEEKIPADKLADAFDMAIEALEKTSGCKGCKQTQIHCFDCARKAPDFYKGEEDD